MPLWLGKVAAWRLVGLLLLSQASAARGDEEAVNGRRSLTSWAASLPVATTPAPKLIVAFSRLPETPLHPAGIQVLALPSRSVGNVRALSDEQRRWLEYSLRLNPPPPPASEAAALQVLSLAGADLALAVVATGTTAATWQLWATGSGGARLIYASEQQATGISGVGLDGFIRAGLGYDGEVLAQDTLLVLARLPRSGWQVGSAALAIDGSSRLLRLARGPERSGSTLLRLLRTDGDLGLLQVVSSLGRAVLSPGTKLQQDAGDLPLPQ